MIVIDDRTFTPWSWGQPTAGSTGSIHIVLGSPVLHEDPDLRALRIAHEESAALHRARRAERTAEARQRQPERPRAADRRLPVVKVPRFVRREPRGVSREARR